MREFVAAGGEMIIHVAFLSKNSPTAELSSGDYPFQPLGSNPTYLKVIR
jgi:hypothetical protein